MKIGVVLFIFVALLFNNNSSHLSTTDNIENEIKNEIDSAYDAFTKAQINMDLDAVLGYYINDDSLAYYRNEDLLMGKEALVNDLTEGFGYVKKVSNIHYFNKDITVLSDDAGVLTTAYYYMLIDIDQDTIKAKGITTKVLKKINNEWKFTQAVMIGLPLDKTDEELSLITPFN